MLSFNFLRTRFAYLRFFLFFYFFYSTILISRYERVPLNLSGLLRHKIVRAGAKQKLYHLGRWRRYFRNAAATAAKTPRYIYKNCGALLQQTASRKNTALLSNVLQERT